MITYDRSAFGVNLILRVHGSAVYRSVIPGFLSILCLLLFRYFRNGDGTFNGDPQDDNDLQHPYAIGVLVSSTTFLIVFRANQGYSRYWEAAGAVYHMMSKWMDATSHTGCYHMQCAHYDNIKPPSFFDYPELNAYYLTRDRERYHEFPVDGTSGEDGDYYSPDDIVESEMGDEFGGDVDHGRRKVLAQTAAKQVGTPLGMKRRKSHGMSPIDRSVDYDLAEASKFNHIILDRAVAKSIAAVEIKNPKVYSERAARLRKKYAFDELDSGLQEGGVQPIPLTGPPRMDGNWGALFNDDRTTFYSDREMDPSSPTFLHNLPSFDSCQGGRTPSLFLQELAHLTSLLNAVALSTLRNDIEGSTSPLGVYKPGSPWPEVDPDKIDNWWLNGSWFVRFRKRFLYFIGVSRSAEERTRYNAARPLQVLGGVSDAEIRFLQMARGPYAKTQLCWYWLSEFIIREHLKGSTGAVGPPIISRIIQFLGDGMIYYNHARKIMFIPFPFPHAQLAVLFVMIAVPSVAFLMDQYAENPVLGSILSFFSVACLSGIHEVARELENPFRNVPNELPLVTMQAQFNEALITMYSGYHPDHFWDPTRHDRHPSDPPPPRRGSGTAQRRRSSAPEEGKKTAEARSPPTSPKRERVVVETVSEAADTASKASAKLPTANGTLHSSNGAAEELKRMQSKMDEYAKEIERLRAMIEDKEAAK